MIEIKNISKSFGGRKVIDDVSFTLQAGRTNLIIGESGSGKTTILKMMVGLHTVDSGQIIYDNVVFNELNGRFRFSERYDILIFDSFLIISLNAAFPEVRIRFDLEIFGIFED